MVTEVSSPSSLIAHLLNSPSQKHKDRLFRKAPGRLFARLSFLTARHKGTPKGVPEHSPGLRRTDATPGRRIF